MGELPEGCIAHMVSLTSPREACRLAVVSPTFKGAAESDAVWSCFFPSDFHSILSRSSSPVEDLSDQSKKKIFFHYAQNHILIDDKKLSFWLDKRSGKKSFMLSAANLAITWGNNNNYWRMKSCIESRFDEVAHLVRVCWFEITGKICTSLLSPSTHYAAFLVFRNAPRSHYGFELPVNAKVGLVGSEISSQRKVYLEVDSELREISQSTDNDIMDNEEAPKQREDRWFEVELGDFYYVGDGSDDGELEVRIFETERRDWKSGIVVQGIEIRPKGDN